MSVTIRTLERTYRIGRATLGEDRVPAQQLDRILDDAVSRGFAHRSLRRLLGQLGHDPSVLDDHALRRLAHTLVEEGRLILEDVTPAEVRQSSVIGPKEPPPGAEPPGTELPTETEQKYELLELVEVVDRGGLGTVGGAAKASRELTEKVARTEKDGAAYKQFINLGKNTDGPEKRHPENDSTIELRARLAWKSGDTTRTLSGKTVKWKLTLTPHGGAGRPGEFKLASEKPGLGGANEVVEKTSTADRDGWASMRLHCSQYAGDQMKVTAEVDTSDGEAIGGAPKVAGPYVSWRKFWYQLTKPKGTAVTKPAASIAAYAKVGADMLEGDKVEFDKDTDPKPPDRTFYPQGMIVTGSADASDKAVIGGHNREWFWKLYNAEASRPVKGHLIVCDAQWDPGGETPSELYEVTASPLDVTLKSDGAWNAGIVKPALKGDLVVTGVWLLDPTQHMQIIQNVATGSLDPTVPPLPAKVTGELTAAHISIPLPRTDLMKVRLTLPSDAPDVTTYKVFALLKLRYGKYYAGESKNVNMLIKYAAGADTSFTQVVSHEFGHGFKMVPDKKNSASLADHAKQYDTADGHGGLGSHCSTGAIKDAVTAGYAGGRFRNGTCIMFHQVSPATCTQTFCDQCAPHLRLQKFNRFS